jgi:hypothetical protein
MRIFYSAGSDPMLLDTGAKLNELHQTLVKFLMSSLIEISLPAEVTQSPAPYQESLNGLRVQKSQGSIVLHLSQDRWLELAGSKDNLAKYVSHFHFQEPEDGDHHHPDHASYMAAGSLGLVIEADSTWAVDSAG